MYDPAFYDRITTGSLESAAVLVPLVLRAIDPRLPDGQFAPSVVDVGCGRGAWASTFAGRRCDVLGVDGPWVTDPLIDHMVVCDLTTERLPELTADLVVCLEVAEHLPEQRAPELVADLCRIATTAILWSAAIPGQGGTGHCNEAWPSWWAPLFEAEGWVLLDGLRQQVWSDLRVEPWYRQNVLLAVPEAEAENYYYSSGLRPPMHRGDLDIAHPTIWQWRVQ